MSKTKNCAGVGKIQMFVTVYKDYRHLQPVCPTVFDSKVRTKKLIDVLVITKKSSDLYVNVCASAPQG